MKSFAAGGVAEDVTIDAIALLGSDAQIQWKRTEKGIVITPPPTGVFKSSNWPVMFRLELD